MHSLGSSEGDVGTLKHVLNNLVDYDDTPLFVISANVLGKQEVVSVIQIGRIKTKGSCT